MATYDLDDAKTYINTRSTNDKKLYNYILSKIVGNEEFLLAKNEIISSIISNTSNIRNDHITTFINNSPYKQANFTYKHTANKLEVWDNTSNLSTVNIGTYITSILIQHSIDDLLKIKNK